MFGRGLVVRYLACGAPDGAGVVAAGGFTSAGSTQVPRCVVWIGGRPTKTPSPVMHTKSDLHLQCQKIKQLRSLNLFCLGDLYTEKKKNYRG